MAIASFESLRSLFARHNVERIFIKLLSPKQDNDKNQVYLGSSENGVFTLFPGTFSLSGLSPSDSVSKHKSRRGQPKPCMALDFYWINPESHTVHQAKRTKLIEYPQYPEARMSGFLSGADWVPDAMRRNSLHKYGSRALALGSNRSGQTFGLVLLDGIDGIFTDLKNLPRSPIQSELLYELSIKNRDKTDKEQLLDELRTIVGEWHPSQIRRTGGKVTPFKGPAGAGNTLESLLEISANAKKEPDKYGFEIKSFRSGGKISLMTPTADRGYEGLHSFREFMDKFGWQSAKDPERQVFNGIYRYLKPNSGNQFILDIHGFDEVLNTFNEDVSEIMPYIAAARGDDAISGWSFQKLYESWSEKHAKACYVEYESRDHKGEGDKSDKEYRYTGNIYLCEGTSIYRYLRAIVGQSVYYDPAHEIKPNKSPSVRPQWRISATKKNFKNVLDQLYGRVELICLKNTP